MNNKCTETQPIFMLNKKTIPPHSYDQINPRQVWRDEILVKAICNKWHLIKHQRIYFSSTFHVFLLHLNEKAGRLFVTASNGAGRIVPTTGRRTLLEDDRLLTKCIWLMELESGVWFCSQSEWRAWKIDVYPRHISWHCKALIMSCCTYPSGRNVCMRSMKSCRLGEN